MMEEEQKLSASLTLAQERERVRLSNVLGEMIGQSVSVLAIELAQLAGSVRGERRRELEKLCLEAREIVSNIRSISQGVHSPTLQYVGLQAAVDGWCRKVSKASLETTQDRWCGAAPRFAALQQVIDRRWTTCWQWLQRTIDLRILRSIRR